MRRGVLKSHSAYNKFAKSEEHARWAIAKRQKLKLKGWWQGGYDNSWSLTNITDDDNINIEKEKPYGFKQ